MTEINSKANAKRGKRQKKVSEACSKVSGCQYAHGYLVHKTIKQIDIVRTFAPSDERYGGSDMFRDQ